MQPKHQSEACIWAQANDLSRKSLNRFAARTSLFFTTGIMTLVGLAASGCVRHDRYDSAKTATHSLQEQLVSAQSERDTAVNVLSSRDRQLAQAEANLDALQEQYNLLAGELDAIDAQTTDCSQQ